MKRARSRLVLLLVLGMLTALLPIGAVAPASAAGPNDLVITGVIDGPLTGGVPKAVELYVVNNIADLSLYGIGSANNGGGTDGEEFTFPAVAATAGQYIYVATEAPLFTDFFGFAPDYTDGSATNINGDDAIELFNNGTVVDVFGDINTDGTGEPWDHLDGWAYRVNETGPDGTTFVLANWTFSGPNALDGETTNATAATPFPTGTYTKTSTPLSGVGTATPDSVTAGSTSLLTVTVTPGDTPPSTGITVEADLTAIGGSTAQSFLDDGTGGDLVGLDGIFSFEATVDSLTADGTYLLPASIADVGGSSASTTIELSVFTPTPDTDMVISGVVDGPLTGGTPKGVEFYVLNDIADLSAYGFGSANNGGGSDGEEFTFPAVAATAGQYIYVASETTGFTSFFGFAPDYTSSAASINGDDAIELFNNGAVIDTFGDINLDGTGQPWDHLDGWAYRVNETGPDGSTFVLANWTFSGPNALDGETSNATAATPFPISTYTDVPPVSMVLSGMVDGPLTGGIPKAIEFYVLNDIADLSVYGFGSANNGGGSDGEEFTFPAVAATAGQYIYVASETPEFGNFFGFAPDYTSSAALINGDDAIELFNDGTVVDTFGDINVDGNGEPWEYLDGWAYRVNETGPDGSTFVLASWTFSGPNALDGETSNATAATPFPIGTYTDVAGPTPLSGVGTADPDSVVAGESSMLTVTVTPNEATPSTGITVEADLSAIGGSSAQAFTDDGGNSFSFLATVDGLTPAGSYSLPVSIEDLEGATASTTIDLNVIGMVAIHEIQGSGAASPLAGQRVAVQGLVTADHQDGDFNGWFMEDLAVDADADPATSNGIFVFEGGNTVDVSVGDVITLEGDVSEFFDMTQISNISNITVVSSGNALVPTVVSLPWTTLDQPEQYEGMYVTIPQDLVISEYFNFDRFGEIVLTTDRAMQPTAVYEPGSTDAADLALANQLGRITLDDNRTSQNPDPALHPNGDTFDLDNLFRGGDTVANVTGVLNYSFGLYKIQPTQGADYTPVNPRTAAADDVGGTLKVASFNVLNYFTTLDDGVNDICGPSGNLECRGADTAEEFARQRAKIISAISAIDADIVGLMEIENNEDAIIDLVTGLNEANGAGTYAYVDTGAIGDDAIKVAFIFQPATVSLNGAHSILDSSVDPLFNDAKNRPALAQTFTELANGESVTVVVNHLKSKGSNCDALGDPDTGDGAGNCNLTRTAAAQALVNWLADSTYGFDDDVLVIGDLNSYDKEDPIDALVAGGYTDLISHFLGEFAYSYVFSGQWGYLDYAMANTSLQSAVTGTTVWHINADEADLIDYDTSFKQDAQDALYAPDAYRASDHDPVIVGLQLDQTAPEVTAELDKIYAGFRTGYFEVDFACTDADANVTCVGDINGITVEDGQRVFLIKSRWGQPWHRMFGSTLFIKDSSFVLTVTGTDSVGNTATATDEPEFRVWRRYRLR